MIGACRAPQPSWAALASVLALVLLAPALAHGQIFLTGFAPELAAPGAELILEGTGFVADPAAHAAFVIDPASDAAALIELSSAAPTHLGGVLGAVAEPFTGDVRAWSGACWKLPGGLHRGQWATYLVQEAAWFVPSAEAEAAGQLEVTTPSAGTRNGVQIHNSIVIPFEDWPAGGGDGPDCGIDLDIMVDGGTAAGDEGGGNTDSADDTHPSGRLIRVSIGVIEGHGAFDATVLVADLANILQSTYGALGVHFAAVGTDLHVTWDGAPILESGFAILSPQAPIIE